MASAVITKNNLTGLTYTKLAALLVGALTLHSAIFLPLARAEAREVVDHEMEVHTSEVTQLLQIIRTDIRELRNKK